MPRSFHAVLAIFLVGTIALTGSGFGCGVGLDSDERDTEFLVAEVDSIDVPAQIAPSDTLTVHFHGRIGPNGCYSIDRIEEERTPGQLTVRPVVRHVTAENVVCPSLIVFLDTMYEVAPPFESGTLDIVVPQPDRPDVTTTVTVQQP